MQIEYKTDEYIVYDTYGVCRIKEIKKMSFVHGEPSRPYYVLSPANASQSTYYVPCENKVLTAKMRRPLNKNEIEKLLDSSLNIDTSWIDNRQSRAEYSREVLKKGITPELFSLIRCLYERKLSLEANGKSLSSTDEGILNSCEKLINEEFSFSLNITAEEVPSYISRCFSESTK